MAGLLSIPSSNADSERGFSILRKIHADQRPTLKQSTTISLVTRVKFNGGEEHLLSAEKMQESQPRL